MVLRRIVNIDHFLLNMNVGKVGEKPENLKKPDDHNDHNHNVDDPFYFPVHGNVGIDQP
jgi:hypothetical protein